MPVLILIAVILLFVGSTYFNSKVKVPDDIELPEKCQGCNLQCDKKDSPLTEEIIEQIKADIRCQEENNEG